MWGIDSFWCFPCLPINIRKRRFWRIWLRGVMICLRRSESKKRIFRSCWIWLRRMGCGRMIRLSRFSLSYRFGIEKGVGRTSRFEPSSRLWMSCFWIYIACTLQMQLIKSMIRSWTCWKSEIWCFSWILERRFSSRLIILSCKTRLRICSREWWGLKVARCCFEMIWLGKRFSGISLARLLT